MIENSIIKTNERGEKGLVFALEFPSLHLIELAAHVGFDAISLDGEHGYFNENAIDDACRVANGYGLSVIARVPDNAAYQINLFLDRGIQGVTGPHIETGAQAQLLADSCLFPPEGTRSWGGGRGTEFNDDHILENKYGGKLEFAKWSNKNMIIMAQIESKLAWDNLDEILAVKGLTGIAGGPNDFAASLGFPGQPDHSERVAATLDADNRARAQGKIAGGDLIITLSASDLMKDTARAFVTQQRNK